MTRAKDSTLAGRLRSVRCALDGLRVMLRTQPNAKIHAAATLAAAGLGLACRLSAAEWCWIVLAIALVWTAEALNTALELLADAVSPEIHPLIGKAKDAAAGGVLAAALGAATIGLLVFVPRLAGFFAGAA